MSPSAVMRFSQALRPSELLRQQIRGGFFPFRAVGATATLGGKNSKWKWKHQLEVYFIIS